MAAGEAVALVADKLKETVEHHGPEAVAFFTGSSKGGLDISFVLRMANLIGTPNVASLGNVCHIPREAATAYTWGGSCAPDTGGPMKCLVIWGSNALETNTCAVVVEVRQALDHGAKLIVIDPRRIPGVLAPDVWLQPRPGSDGLLALAWLKVIVEEALYDRLFIEKHTNGFPALREMLAGLNMDDLAERTWVPRSQIEAAARLYACSRPAAIQWGNAIEHTTNAFQTCRAIAILRAVTGNLDVPGGEALLEPVPLMSRGDFNGSRGARARKPAVVKGYPVIGGFGVVPSQEMVRAISEQAPYPVRFGWLVGTNPMVTYAGAGEVEAALKKLDFLVVNELFSGPTSTLADVVLPVAHTFEFNEIGNFGGRGWVSARTKVVEPPGDCASDVEWLTRAGRAAGYSAQLWESESAMLEAMLKPSGLSWAHFRDQGIVLAGHTWHKHESKGFPTPTGKVEIYSDKLKSLGLDPLPSFEEPPYTPFSAPERTAEYPLVLTNGKSPNYYHSGGRNIPGLRKKETDPVVTLNPATAARQGLSAGDWVRVETPHGSIRQKLALDPGLHPGVAFVAFGWWFPERRDAVLFDYLDSSLNAVTASSPADPAVGAPNLKGVMCRVVRA
jgi:anaerobic selenocysteine-containing dehydrogenase